MSDISKPGDNQDLAWAAFQVPLSPGQLGEFCRDIERLFRINPYLEFHQWEQIGVDQYRFSGRNSSQQPAFDFDLRLTTEYTPDGLIIHYDEGIKHSTTFKIEATGSGSKLTITDDYSGTANEGPDKNLNEVDRSLIKWANDLQAYLLMWKRWSWLRPWRWYMRRIWQPLKPIGRRIVYIFIWISIVEVALIVLGVAIYWIEYT